MEQKLNKWAKKACLKAEREQEPDPEPKSFEKSAGAEKIQKKNYSGSTTLFVVYFYFPKNLVHKELGKLLV